MNKIYIAFYKGKGNLIDRIVRFFTKGKYSHCELVVKKIEPESGYHYEYSTVYDCYSSSPRDGGVRCKQINVENGNWDLKEVKNITEQDIKCYFEKTKGIRYDFCGAIGVTLLINQDKNKIFCSEWVFNCLFNSENGWRFSPNDLDAIL
ncbi:MULTISPECIES: enoyl-CoA hydratase [Pasteurellaceae]|uniref:Enoyl-CoA hydratase n=1 Tax=Pasteurella atlantica TaxID=2827233 RepID=A0AAW8CT24_9PAST|nr:enoyl-CoA hydratase [Pasteurella atlantica]MBR0574060.1 enoyl-CoA hydratase [Pasteurella atlantica]MDP8040589.1 enoyl-CoA hydratase [Pasteurella atlantica]MDP8042719.1 enoyl-CoA hydratase [Pasteurella atlantica]MDP8044806.1 enoyl-CoA hydratase [Pasteurella atlantica]MDP8046389.1 enoyl-CoA hydratase [Pasteurella atlantica]